jgi:DNA (cytosine-5)-methyltransferase 1
LGGSLTVALPNHYSATLSALDMAIVRSVPPGGNWKNVPHSVDSKRLETIRASFARGEGSRSTYYGRLLREAPSYTINTYFSRPGNGCHIHYDQDRVLSQREAARFQSFPDSFVFHGSKTAINGQIGNAVAPLLAYQVARTMGEPGVFIDLFAGAGGLSLGFALAGWTPLVANDLDRYALQTYARNIHEAVVLGDIRDPLVRNKLLERARAARRATPDRQFLVLGGPPCQGFSTAGKKRSLDDERNHLFRDYADILDELSPDGFVFENVTGLLNFQKGQVFRDISAVLAETMHDIRGGVLRSEDFGVPQRRWRVFVTGRRESECPLPPSIVTRFPGSEAFRAGLPTAPGAEDAIGDLPPLEPGEDGSSLSASPPGSHFQKLVQGFIQPEEYLAVLEAQRFAPEKEQLKLVG